MVMETVSDHAIIEFTNNMHVRAQQIKARLRPWVQIKPLKAKKMAYDGLGTVEAQELNERFATVEFSDIEHFRREIKTTIFGVTLPVDDGDIEERLKDPSGEYASACLKAMERKFDRVVVDAMFATVNTGEEFDTAVTFAGEGGLTLDCTSGVTYEKLLEGHANFIDGDVGNDMPERLCMGITGDEHTDLMTENELTSGDFSREYVVDKGKITEATGIALIRYAANGAGGADPIIPIVGGNRQSFLMTDQAMCVGLTRNFTVKIQPRHDKYNTKQIQITGRMGAVRTEAKLIQKVTLTP